MADETGISWCDSTFNPWVGCSKVSPGCAHCYAETWSNRYNRAVWGDEGTRVRTSVANWRKPRQWQAAHEAFEKEHGRRRRVFCASLADVFEPRPELDPWRGELLDLIEATPDLDWLLLTKRPDVAQAWSLLRGRWPLPNVWLGTSIENNRFTWRADVLREIPATVRFLSCEPLLGSLYSGLESRPTTPSTEARRGDSENGEHRTLDGTQGTHRAPLDLTGIDWVIVGGESGGKRSRPMKAEWVREIRHAVLFGDEPNRRERPTRPAFHFKQWGSHDESGAYLGPAPTSGGCLLDSAEWKEFPR